MALSPILTALLVIRIAGPSVLTLLTLSLFFLRPTCNDHDNENSQQIISVIVAKKTPRRALILSFLSFIAASFFLDGAVIVASAVLSGIWEGSTPQWRYIEVADVLGLLSFSGLAALGTWKDLNGVEVWTTCRVKFFAMFALVVDIAQLVLLSLTVELVDKPKFGISPVSHINVTNVLHFGLVVLRVICLLILFPGLLYPRTSYVPAARNVEEANASSSLLAAPPPHGPSQYGTFASSPQTPHDVTRAHSPSPQDGAPSSANPQVNPPRPGAPGPLKPNPRKEVDEDPTWAELGRRLRRLTPYLWPKKDRSLQFLAMLCIVILAIGRVVNFLIPLTLGVVVQKLEHAAGFGWTTSPWPSLVLYVILRFLQSPGGLSALRDTLWAPVMQYSDREMSQLSFDHLLNLSLGFHNRRKTGEVLRILDRGASINHILELLLFNIGPIFVDIMVALIFFFVAFGWSLALVIMVVMVAYVYASVIMTRWRTKIRRRMNDRDVITRGIHTDCLLNYETVKYFCGEQHEAQRYQEAIREYQALEYRVMVSLNMLNLVQNLIFSLGIMVGSFIVAWQIIDGKLNQRGEPMGSSDFVIFITYLAQLYGPLNSLGYIYRSINQSLVDTERLMKLLEEQPEVKDKPNAAELHVTSGEIEFENVSFSYDGRTTALNGVSFKVPKNSTVALVGESGSGKSTILRLLYRFYDLQPGQGRILIDGQDIREVTQRSLRQAIGVVPQDSVLFNSSIGYNIGYGKFGAQQSEIEAAAQAAQMHERILSFPDGYATKVGERGVRLSGGEKQRVAIARTLLKDPPILLLDEATSALDTSTEKDIQKALQNLVKGRSSLSIAHRLSTIANADVILVLKEGQIIESGNLRELTAQNGVFATMWADQVSAEDDVPEQANVLKEGITGYLVGPEVKEEVLDGPPESQNTVTTHVVSPEPQIAFPSESKILDPTQGVVTDSPVMTAATDLPGEVQPEAGAVEQVERPKSYAEVASMPVDTAAGGQSDSTPFPTPFPTSEPTSEAEAKPMSIAFPSQFEIASSPETPVSPGVTFSSDIASPPSRSGTPDPESKLPKRIRKTSQNIQKFARTLSFAARRQSVIVTPTKADNSTTPRTSRDDSSLVRGEGSIGGDSATDRSGVGSDDKEGKGKGKKIKKKATK